MGAVEMPFAQVLASAYNSVVTQKDNTNPGCEGSDGEPEPEPEPEVVATPEPEPVAPQEIVSIATLGGKALFDTDSEGLNGEGEQALADLLVQLEKYQEISVMYVKGHTDSRGSEAYNQGLSERRAATVAAYLEAAYPDVDVTSQGMGESVPVETTQQLKAVKPTVALKFRLQRKA